MSTINRKWRQCLSGVVLCVPFCGVSLAADVVNLDLRDDFGWTVGEWRSEISVMREAPDCVGFTKGKDVEFASEGKPFSIIAYTVSAQKSGTFELIPELFLMRDGHQYRVCRGVRIVEPKPSPLVSAFHPPRDASVWPGHAGKQINCKRGDSVVFELLFDHVWNGGKADLLVASNAMSPSKTNGSVDDK